MKKTLILIFFISILCFGQDQSPYKNGEWLNFKLSYSGWIKAGKASLTLKEDKLNELYHVKAIGKTTGPIKWFFKVEDYYQSYFSNKTGLPKKFIRKINEGGHTKNLIIDFDQTTNKAIVNNIKKNSVKEFVTKPNVHDMLSVFYFLRNNYSLDQIKKTKDLSVDMFFDSENYEFKMKFLGLDTINTKFGKIKCIKLRPFVQSGRVFKEKESLTLWISADNNKIPIRIKADLVVGSIRVDLDAFSGLNHPFEINF
ncbi:DUF3108 domain-containing protein [Flavobacteriaceae bacterium]|nr:DUF3108 domain-containing protein [Flavobacteriales bacterium]MBL6878136.1 DUF3108 domain-containing protein [Flavobacteriaceae bacterium]MDA9849653.1 DUF3108 domain-containing protein [Flavobacteriaceae bacterium]